MADKINVLIVDDILETRESVRKLLQFENDSAFVEIETDEQVFEKRFVTTGLSDGINIEILSGLNEDDKIKKLN